mmetsp:Transcript_116802/g.330461  ORF Transcript_116802/g.330461 Transcript_116802/m.330461 type:complete len:284 (-) Transcript_116802:1456-2307(-)
MYAMQSFSASVKCCSIRGGADGGGSADGAGGATTSVASSAMRSVGMASVSTCVAVGPAATSSPGLLLVASEAVARPTMLTKPLLVPLSSLVAPAASRAESPSTGAALPESARAPVSTAGALAADGSRTVLLSPLAPSSRAVSAAGWLSRFWSGAAALVLGTIVAMATASPSPLGPVDARVVATTDWLSSMYCNICCMPATTSWICNHLDCKLLTARCSSTACAGNPAAAAAPRARTSPTGALATSAVAAATAAVAAATGSLAESVEGVGCAIATSPVAVSSPL